MVVSYVHSRKVMRKNRNTVSVLNTSDKSVERQGDDPQEVKENEFPKTSPSIQESDKLDDMSPIPIEDSGPKEGGEDKTELQKEETEPKSKTQEKEEQKPTKESHDESYGLLTRKKKGSQRPPDIPGVVWVSMSPKQRQQCIEDYKRTGYFLS